MQHILVKYFFFFELKRCVHIRPSQGRLVETKIMRKDASRTERTKEFRLPSTFSSYPRIYSFRRRRCVISRRVLHTRHLRSSRGVAFASRRTRRSACLNGPAGSSWRPVPQRYRPLFERSAEAMDRRRGRQPIGVAAVVRLRSRLAANESGDSRRRTAAVRKRPVSPLRLRGD